MDALETHPYKRQTHPRPNPRLCVSSIGAAAFGRRTALWGRAYPPSVSEAALPGSGGWVGCLILAPCLWSCSLPSGAGFLDGWRVVARGPSSSCGVGVSVPFCWSPALSCRCSLGRLVLVWRAITGRRVLAWLVRWCWGVLSGNVSGGCVGVLAWEAQTPSAGVYKVVHLLFKLAVG